MSVSNFIFSDLRHDRLKRHLLFWISWYIYFSLLHAVNPYGPSEVSYFRYPAYTFTESFFLILVQLPITYCMLYIILPVFILKKKYIQGLIGTALIWFLGGALHLFTIRNIMPEAVSWILTGGAEPPVKRFESANFLMAVMGNFKGAFTIAAFAMLFKIGKYWYLKEQRNLQLQKQNTEAQLQLLTAQVHPHFLFNTLNNIYSQAQNESPRSSKMIMGLSDLLRYILYEGRKPLVPLDKELQMILEYINLEKIRYGNKLDLHYLVADKTSGFYIAPLLLLPFVENCFKHGASNMLQDPWINLTIEVKDTTLIMKLMNGKAACNDITQSNRGIGISNARQRLELLYKDKYALNIREEDDVFIVDLKIELVKLTEPQPVNHPLEAETIYA